MNERTLSRKLSTSVVEALKSHGHILVVKGGAQALARELDELMAPRLATIEPRLEPRALVGGEPTSTFGSEAIDDTVEEMVDELTQALMDSDHVEDVFAEDNVIRRDIFRVVREGLLHAPLQEAEVEAEQRTVAVLLDTLGYVAATVSKRADEATLRDAFERAAAISQARFLGYDTERREATFRIDDGGPDERLELEEAVADELADMVEAGLVELPTVERTVELARPVPAAELRAARQRIEGVSEVTLLRTGCAATWELADPRTVRITFTPLSDHDSRDIDHQTAAFGREVNAIFSAAPAAEPTIEAKPRSSRGAAAAPPSGRGKPEPAAAAEPAIEAPTPSTKRRAAAKEKEKEAAPSSKKTAPKKAAKAPAKKAAAPKAKKTPAKKG